MTKATRFIRTKDGDHFNAIWAFSAPWAHPVWPEYVLILYDLRPLEGQRTILYMPEATHEFTLSALDPAYPYPSEGEFSCHPLRPSNLGYQFRATDDEAAIRRVQLAVTMVEQGKLSPDTDYRAVWDDLFKDGYSLVRSAFATMAEARNHVRH